MFRANRYPKDWKQIRTSILERARNACEQCRAPNRTVIARGAKGSPAEGTYMLEDGTVRNEVTGQDLGLARGSEYDVDRFVEVILTVAHVDHDERNNDPSNLRALCQRCHLALDRADNARRRRAGARAGCAVAELPLGADPAYKRGVSSALDCDADAPPDRGSGLQKGGQQRTGLRRRCST